MDTYEVGDRIEYHNGETDGVVTGTIFNFDGHEYEVQRDGGDDMFDWLDGAMILGLVEE